MNDIVKWEVRFKRGLKRDLPESAPAGTPLFTTDTRELFIGQGAGQPLTQISGSGTGPTQPSLSCTKVDLDSFSYYYYGLTGDSWRINRFTRSDLSVVVVASESNNPGVTSLDLAWTDRATLVYS